MISRIQNFALLALLAVLGASASPAAHPPPAPSLTPILSVTEVQGSIVLDNIADNDPANFGRDFRQVMVGSGSAPITIRIANGDTALPLLNLALPVVATGAADYSLNTSGYVTSGLAAGQSTEFTVVFNPGTSGTRAGVITFDWVPDPSAAPGVWATFSFNVTGEGLTSPAPKVVVYEATTGGPRVFNNQSIGGARDYGDWVAGVDPSAPRTIVIANEGAAGGADLTLTLPSLTGADFILDTTGFSTGVAAGSSTSFTVAFAPQVAFFPGVGATVSFGHNDGAETSPFVVNFYGQGILQARQLRVSDAAGPHFSGTPGPQGTPPAYIGSSLTENAAAAGPRDLGDISLGASVSLTITVSNAGVGVIDHGMTYWPGPDLVLMAPSVFAGSGDFSVDTAGFTAQIGEAVTTTFTIDFNPQTLGAHSAEIILGHSDDSMRTPFRIHITANVVAAGSGGGSGSTGGDGGSGCIASGQGGWQSWAALLALLSALAAGAALRRRV